MAKALEGQQLRQTQRLGRPIPGEVHALRSHPLQGRLKGGGSPRSERHSVVVPIGGREERRWSNPLTRTLGSMAVGVLLMMLSSGISCSCVGRGGSDDGAACSDHIHSSARALVCLRTPPQR